MSESTGFTEIDVPETLRLEQAANAAETQPEEQTERQPSPRETAMAAIAERRREAIERELAHGVVMEDEARIAGGAEPLPHTPEETDGTEAPEAANSATATGQASPPAPASEPAPSGTPGRHVVNVGGQTFVVDDAQFEHLANIGAMASVAMQQQSQQHVQQHQAPQPVARAPEPTVPIDRTRLAETWRKMSYGNEEEGVAALSDLLAAAQPAAVDPRAITEQAKAEMRAETQLQQNLLAVAREFPDVMGPVDRAHTAEEMMIYRRRAQLAALALHDIRQRDAMLGQQRSDLDVYREAAMNVRASLGTAPPLQSGQEIATATPATQAARATVATSTERLERKRAAPRTPSAVSRASMGQPIPQQKTASDIVAWMAQRRNQQSPVRT